MSARSRHEKECENDSHCRNQPVPVHIIHCAWCISSVEDGGKKLFEVVAPVIRALAIDKIG